MTSQDVLPPLPLLRGREDEGFSEWLDSVECFTANPCAGEARRVWRNAAAAVHVVREKTRHDPVVGRILSSVRQSYRAGLSSYAPRVLAGPQGEEKIEGWRRVLALMLTGPAWASNSLPALREVPDWLWKDFLSWALSPPQFPNEPSAADGFVRTATPLMSEVAQWAERNPGSGLVRRALQVFLDTCATSDVPAQATVSLDSWAQARARLLVCAGRLQPTGLAPAGTSRLARAFRVGLLLRSFGAGHAKALATALGSWDPTQYELLWFAFDNPRSREELQAQAPNGTFQLLPAEPGAAVHTLSTSSLDVLIFADDLVRKADHYTMLATVRMAPLQAVLGRNLYATGFPHIDLHIASYPSTGDGDTLESFGTRQAYLPADELLFGDVPSDERIDVSADIRAGDPTAIFVSAGDVLHLSTQLSLIWTRLLQRLPDARLVLVVPPSIDAVAAGEFAARVMGDATAGAAVEISRGDLTDALASGRVFLDTWPCSNSKAVAQAAAAGCQVVTLSDGRYRSATGAQWAEIQENFRSAVCVVGDETTYIERAIELSKPEVNAPSGLAPSNALKPDPLGVSITLASLLECAYDELLQHGRDEFRRRVSMIATTPDPEEVDRLLHSSVEADATGQYATAATLAHDAVRRSPFSSPARGRLGRALLRLGKPAEASVYVLAALAGHEDEFTRWHDAGEVFAALGQPIQAIQAFEAALRLNPRSLDSWKAIADLARAVGHGQIAADADQFVQELSAKSALAGSTA